MLSTKQDKEQTNPSLLDVTPSVTLKQHVGKGLLLLLFSKTVVKLIPGIQGSWVQDCPAPPSPPQLLSKFWDSISF